MNTKNVSYQMHIGRQLLLLALLVLALLISGCNGETPAPPPLEEIGPQTWVEFPYEGTILPMEPVTLVAYSTDPLGIVQIQVSLNGETLPTIPVSAMTTDGSTRLARIDQSWQPPGEGEYLVEVVGVSANGTSGQIGTTKFCIVTCEPDPGLVPADSLPTNTPTPAPEAIETEAPTSEPTQPPVEEISISFYASPSAVDAGSCTNLYWDVTGSETVTLNGSTANRQGSQQRCPCETESHNLQVYKSDGSAEDRWVTIDAYGSCTSPQPTEPPTVPPPPPAPSDSTGPNFDTGYLIWEDCKFFGAADLSDPSGISWAKFGYNLNDGGWLWVWMADTGSGWQSEVGISVMDGIGTPIGEIDYEFHAMDNLGNESYSGALFYNYFSCDG
jgi:hypothetical protein